MRLLAYLAAATALIVLDHRGAWLQQVRSHAERAVQPLWWVAGLPARLGDDVRDNALTRAKLAEENRTLRNALLISGARVARLQAAAAEAQRARALLNAADDGRLDVQLVPILDVDLDPSRQRLMLAAGGNAGVHEGQAVIDDGGLMGQVIAVSPFNATVLLLTDPGHVVPAQVARSGVRLLVTGNGRGDQLSLVNVPLTGDIRMGDALVTSGLGDRFPPGFAIGTVTALRPDDSRAYLVGDVRPAAHFDRGRDVLLLRRTVRVGTNALQRSSAMSEADVAFGTERYPASGAQAAAAAPAGTTASTAPPAPAASSETTAPPASPPPAARPEPAR